MNYRLDVASLIVDPKGFPTRQLPLPKGSVHCEEHCAEQRTLQHLRSHLLGNWVLYLPTDMVELDFCLGQQARLLNDCVERYQGAVWGERAIDAGLYKLQTSLEEQLRVLAGCLLRAQFYEIPLELEKMYRRPRGIGSLLSCCDSFRVLEALSHVLERSEEQEETKMLVEDDQSRLQMLSEALLQLHEFTGGMSTMFEKDWQPNITTFHVGNSSIDITELARKHGPTVITLRDYERRLKVEMSELNRAKCWLFINIIKHRHNIGELTALLQFALRVGRLGRFPQSLLNEQNLHTQLVRIIVNWQRFSNDESPTIVGSGCRLYVPELIDFVCDPSTKLQPWLFLNYANVCCRACSDIQRRERLQKVAKVQLRLLLQSKMVMRYAEQIFQLYANLQLDNSELFQYFLLSLKKLLQEDTDWSAVDVFELERGMMHFFRWFMSEPASSNKGIYSPYYKHIVHPTLLSMLKKRMDVKTPTAKELRITHFIFNQALYFGLQIDGFDTYMHALIAEQDNLKLFVWIMRRFSQNNQLMFKMNFKFVHRLVEGIYSRGEETCMRNIDLVQLYWETAARFLMLWGSRSYLQEQTDVLKQHYDMLLAKVVDLAPHLNKAHKQEEQSLKCYLNNRYQQNPKYMQCWLNFLAFKQRTFFENTIYTMVFVKEELSQSHLKSLLRFALGLCSPLTVCNSPSEQSEEPSFFDDIDALTSEFALETLECVHTFLQKWKRLDLSWMQQCHPSVLMKLWQSDRRDFLRILTEDHDINNDRYQCLLKLRRFESHLQLYNNLMEKLNQQSREEFKIIAEIEKFAAEICIDLWKQLWEPLTRARIEYFCENSEKLRVIGEDPHYQLHHCELEAQIEQKLFPSGSSFLCFERSHITNNFQILRLSRQLFDNTVRGNPSLFIRLTEQRIRLPLAFQLTGRSSLYRIIGRCIELIRTIENYFVCGTEQEKQVKCREFIPLKLSTVETLTGSFNFLTLMVSTLPVKDVYVRKLGEILVRQLKKYFTGFLLHDLLELNTETNDEAFTKLLTTHMNLHLSMLGFASTIYGFYEDTHSCYVEVLETYVNGHLLRPSSLMTRQELEARKRHTCQFILSVFNMFLHSTFKLSCRVRSALFHQLINLYEKLTRTPKRAFNCAILYYLRLNFQTFMPFELTEDMKMLMEGDVEEVERIDPMNIPIVAPIKTICTQAMVINLLSRNNFETLLLGVKCIFANIKGVDCYLRYLVRVSQELVATSKIDDTDLETIILDVYGSLETILEPCLEEASHQSVLSMLLQIFHLLAKTQHPLGQIRSNLTKHLTNLLFAHPTEEAMKQLHDVPIDNGGVVLEVVRCEYEIAKTCRSSLHLLNCLYLDQKSMRFVKDNWSMVVENSAEDTAEQHAKEVFAKVVDGDLTDFLVNNSSQPKLVSDIIDAFVKEFERVESQPISEESCVYGRFRILLGLMTKMPSLISFVVHYETLPTQLSFLNFMLQRVLRANYQMVAQLVLVLLKTNGGFQRATDGTLLSQNFLLNCQIQGCLIDIISDPSGTELLWYVHASKLLELLLERGQQSLFGLYQQRSQPKLPDNVITYHRSVYQTLRCRLLQNVLQVISNQPLMCRHLMSLLAILLQHQFEDCSGYDLQENLVYFMNQELLGLFRENTGVFPRQLLLAEIKTKFIALESNPKQNLLPSNLINQAASNLFVNRRYCVVSPDDRTIITREVNEIADLAAELVQQNKISRKLYNLHQRLGKAMLDSTDDDFPTGQARLASPNLEESGINEGINPFQQRFFQQDSLIMPEEDDGIIDETPTQNEEKPQIAVSSFEQLHEDYIVNIETVGLSENRPAWTPSITNLEYEQPRRSPLLGSLLQSESNAQAVFKRVQKLDLMGDLELGVDITHKIQFLSNDELLKMIQVSDGRLLLGLQAEKQKRGLSGLKSARPGPQEETTVRYLDELYVGCRNNTVLQELLKNGMTVVPQVSEVSLINVLNEYLCAPANKPNQEIPCKVLTLLSMNNQNMYTIAQLSMFVLALSEKQARLLDSSPVGFPEPVRQLNRRSQLTECLSTTKSRMVNLIAELYQQKIGLPIWLYGEFSSKQLTLRNLPSLTVLAKASKLFEQLPAASLHYRLLDLVLHNFVSSKAYNIESYELLIGCMRSYIDACERKHHDGYPYHLVQELDNFHQKDIQSLASLILREEVRAPTGSIHNELLKLLLQVYPNSYECFMTQFIRQLGDELRVIMEDSLKHFRNFRVSFSLKPQLCQQINRDKERLSKLVDSYLLMCKEKDSCAEARLEHLRAVLTDVCFDLVPWFREWRFQVQNRTENYEFCCRMIQLKKRLATFQLGNQFDEAERTEQERITEELEFAGFKCKKINEFLADFLRPVHQSISVGLLHGFVKAQELLDMMANCFMPNSDWLAIIAPAYRKVSSVWQAVLAFGSLNIEEDGSGYHTMSNLQTRQMLKSKNEFGPRTSTLNFQSQSHLGPTKQRRSSVRLSIATTNPFNIDKLVHKFLRHTEVMATFIEEGSRLTPMLSRHGGLQVKLKTIRRKKTGTVKEIEIDRQKVWFDTLLAIDSNFVSKDIRIRFRNELGVDYGGLTKEWLTIITRQLFNPMFGLFELSANHLTIQPSKLSYLVPNHLMHFRKLGVLVGKALVEGWNLQINFTRSFLKHLLGCTIYVEDLQDIDPQTCKSLMWILENEIDESMEIVFSYTTCVLGETKVVPLCENGDNILVNQINKKEYVKALCKAKMTDQIREQSRAFMQGLESVIPYSILRNINYKELGIYLAGMPTINLTEMRQHAKYNGFNRTDKVIEWFWLALHDYSQEMLANFLFFLTGSFKVPYGGFKDYPIVLNRVSAKDHLPVAHTCFNTLDLSDYTDRKTLAAKLLLSVNEGRGFNVS